MIDRIKALLGPGASAPATARHDEVALAAAALLVEAAWRDDSFDAAERAHVEALLGARFGLSGEETRTLVSEAEARIRDQVQLLPFSRAIRDHFDHDQRVEMVEMLWQVVYADGVLHDHEAQLMRRIGGLIYVSDRERGEARKRALEKLRTAAKPA